MRHPGRPELTPVDYFFLLGHVKYIFYKLTSRFHQFLRVWQILAKINNIVAKYNQINDVNAIILIETLLDVHGVTKNKQPS